MNALTLPCSARHQHARSKHYREAVTNPVTKQNKNKLGQGKIQQHIQKRFIALCGMGIWLALLASPITLEIYPLCLFDIIFSMHFCQVMCWNIVWITYKWYWISCQNKNHFKSPLPNPLGPRPATALFLWNPMRREATGCQFGAWVYQPLLGGLG